MYRLVVSYDISEDRRRRRLAKRLAGILDRVQYSVFEGAIRDSALERIRRAASREIDPETDSVRIYQLCKRCREATEIVGTGITPPEEPEDIVV